MKPKRNFIWRTIYVLMALVLATTSLTLTNAKYVSKDVLISNEFKVYNLIAYTFQNVRYSDQEYTCANAPAGEWAFFARGTHSRDNTPTGKPGVFLGIYRKATAGYFTIGTKRGGNRAVNSGGQPGSGGACAYIFDNIARPTSNPGNTDNWVVVAGGGGGKGVGNNSPNNRGGDAGGQSGNTSSWWFWNGPVAPIADGGVVEPSPTYPTWSELGFMGGYGATANNSNGNSCGPTTDRTNTTAAGGGGAGVTGGRAKGGDGGNRSIAINGADGGDGGWFSGGNGGNYSTSIYNTGGGGCGVWGGGGGGAGGSPPSGGGGGGSSFSGAIAVVPTSSGTTYKDYALDYFWELVGDKHTTTTGSVNTYDQDGWIILVWLGP